jgi:hypothetical protein
MGYMLIHAGGDEWRCPSRECDWAITAPVHNELAQEIAASHALWHDSDIQWETFFNGFLTGAMYVRSTRRRAGDR